MLVGISVGGYLYCDCCDSTGTVSHTADTTLENWVGRTKADSMEQPRKTVSAHVARMVGGTTKPARKPYELVRHSQPYGTVTGESGLFFIG